MQPSDRPQGGSSGNVDLMEGVPFSLALVAGALSTLNPCGFPLLPTFLSFYVGADAAVLPSASSRTAQGLITGLLVTAGFLGIFIVVGLPVSYGARAVARAVPFAGIGIGLVLTVLGVSGLTGRRVGLRLPFTVSPGGGRGARAMVLFGVGYGIASLACTLPIFLAVVGASLSTGGTAAGLAVFVAYGSGMAAVLLALALAAALLQRGLSRRLSRLLPYLPRVSAALLMVSGVYLTYYWVRFRFGPTATVASDPIVGMVSRFSARIEVLASSEGIWLVVAAAGVVAVAIARVAWQWRPRQARTAYRRRTS